MDYGEKDKCIKSTFKSYAVGFLLSCALTLASYFFVTKEIFSKKATILGIAMLGIIQAYVQLIYFFHLNKEPKPRFNLAVCLFMALVAVILVFGSLWIMYNLDYRTMRG
jgi:cytochrome o ubiquinol oxidase subunit IV